jgi:hypothetical protein
MGIDLEDTCLAAFSRFKTLVDRAELGLRFSVARTPEEREAEITAALRHLIRLLHHSAASAAFPSANFVTTSDLCRSLLPFYRPSSEIYGLATHCLKLCESYCRELQWTRVPVRWTFFYYYYYCFVWGVFHPILTGPG